MPTTCTAAVVEAEAKGKGAVTAAARGIDSERLRNGAPWCVDEE
jgi:hypothetical protein